MRSHLYTRHKIESIVCTIISVVTLIPTAIVTLISCVVDIPLLTIIATKQANFGVMIVVSIQFS